MGSHLSVDIHYSFARGGAVSELDPVNAVAQRDIPEGHQVSAQHLLKQHNQKKENKNRHTTLSVS